MSKKIATSTRTDERAFTRVDLLAVLVALCALAAVVLPALAHSDDNGTRMVCLNNLRQMGMASTMYAEDNLDYLAFCNWDGGTAPGPGWLYGPYAAHDPTVYPYNSHPGSAWTNGLWFKYVQNQKYYLCPVDLESKYYSQRANKLSSYLMNGAVCGFQAVNAYVTCKTTDAWNPNCWLLWEPGDSMEGAFTFNDGASIPTPSPYGFEGPGATHTANGSEVLTVGGSVQFLTLQTLLSQGSGPVGQGAGPGGKTLAWWSPFAVTGN